LPPEFIILRKAIMAALRLIAAPYSYESLTVTTFYSPVLDVVEGMSHRPVLNRVAIYWYRHAMSGHLAM
jgi:hypothetical protein